MSQTMPQAILFAAVLLFAIPSSLAAAQQQTTAKVQERIEMRPGVVVNPDTEVSPEAIAAMELGLDLRTIKGRPFWAELIIETERRLADGNSIQRRITGHMYRDSQGRQREERTIERPEKPDAPRADITAKVGPLVTLRDPENRVHITLFPGMKAGFRAQVPQILLDSPNARRTTPWTPRPDQKATRIALGYQMIDGLQCEGRQERVTIPAGAVGNPFPLEVITERWYSEDLQINLIVKRIDPRTGETTIRLANIVTEEPPAGLFEIPSDYQIRDANTTAIPLRKD